MLSELGGSKDRQAEESKVGASLQGALNPFESIHRALGETVGPGGREGQPNGRFIALARSGKGLPLWNGGIETRLEPSRQVSGAPRADQVLKLAAQTKGTLDLRMARYSGKGRLLFGGEIVGWGQERPDQLTWGRQHGRTEWGLGI